jgi:predicted DNA-binding ribbon-helix-helix protein
LAIFKEQLQRLAEERATTLAKLLDALRSELYSFAHNCSNAPRVFASQERQKHSEETLERRVKDF